MLPTWGVTRALGSVPQRVAVGQGLGVGDVEPRAAERAVPQGGDEVVGHDVATPGDVDEAGALGQQVEAAAVDQALGLRG